MRKLLTIVLICSAALSCTAQRPAKPTNVPYQNYQQYSWYHGYFRADSGYMTIARDTNFSPITPMLIYTNYSGGAFYFWNMIKWQLVGSGGSSGGGVTTSQLHDSLVNYAPLSSLSNYLTTSSFNSTIANYVTTSSFNSTIANYVTLNTTQTVPAAKTWSAVQRFNNDVGIGGAPDFQFDVQNSITGGRFYFDGKRIGLGLNGNLLIGALTGFSFGSLATDNTVLGSTALQRAIDNVENTALGSSSQGQAKGDYNTSGGKQSLFLTWGSNNTAFGRAANIAGQGERTTSIGSQAGTAKIVDSTDIGNGEVQIGTRRYSGSGTGSFISAQSLVTGATYPFNIRWDGTPPEPYNTSDVHQIFANGTILNSNTIELDGTPFTTTGTSTTSFILYNKQDNSIAIGYNVVTDSSNQISIGNSSNTIFKSNKFVVDITATPTIGDVLTFTGTKAQWASPGGGGGGSYSFVSPLSETGGIVSIPNASTTIKGVSSYNANDFNTSSGIITIDYASGQKVTPSQPGFLTAGDYNTMMAKIGIASPIAGDMIWYNGTAWARLPKGNAGQKLTMVGTTPTWTDTLASTSINYAYSILTDAPTISLNGSTNINFKVTLGGNRILQVSNIVVGKVYKIEVTQGTGGNKILTLPVGSKVASGYGSGTSITLTPTAGAIDYLSFWSNGTNYFWTSSKNYQ